MAGQEQSNRCLLETQEREREYSPSSAIGGDYQQYLRAYAEESAKARSDCKQASSYQYGRLSSQSLDLVIPAKAPEAAPPPLLVFIHGGYWQELSKRESFFAAADCARSGIAFAAIDYTLAPEADLDQIVSECRDALDWLHRQAASLGYDRNRIFVAGSSAGAHLAAMTAFGRPNRAGAGIAGLVLVSGIYDLEPLIGTSVNAALGLDVDAARRNSPLLATVSGFPPAILCWGEVETSAFKRQSRVFAAHLAQSGTRVHTFEVAGKNHFDIILDLARPATCLGEAVIDIVLEERSAHAVV